MGGMVDVGEIAARDVEVLAEHLGEFMKPYVEVIGWSPREKQLEAFPVVREARQGRERVWLSS